MITALKIALILSISGSAVCIGVYTWITRFAAWRNQIGLTLQLEATTAILTWLPLLVAAFWVLSPRGTDIGSWCLIGFLGLSGIIMYWRAAVFWREREK